MSDLKRCYELTDAELDVLERLAQGRTVKEIARARKVQTETVRTQIKRIFRKTGTHRQAELILMVLKARK